MTTTTSLRVHHLRSPSGARKIGTKRLGRGPGTGQGKTAGKGHKGQKARAGGGKLRPGFEGGQNPLIRRTPKWGFTNIFAREKQAVTLRNLEKLPEGKAITPETLKETGLIKSLEVPVKIIHSTGLKLSRKLDIKAHFISKGAREAIEKAGGRFEELKG